MQRTHDRDRIAMQDPVVWQTRADRTEDMLFELVSRVARNPVHDLPQGIDTASASTIKDCEAPVINGVRKLQLVVSESTQISQTTSNATLARVTERSPAHRSLKTGKCLPDVD